MNAFKRLRMAKGMTAKEVADQLNIPLVVYYYYERGTRFPHVKRLQAIAEFHGVTVDELLK